MRQRLKAELFIAVTIVGLGLGACSTVRSAGDGDTDDEERTPDVAALTTIDEVDCGFETESLNNKPTCYSVAVPEDWSNPDPDDQVVLQVAVFSAVDSVGSDAAPVIDLGGDLGEESLEDIPFFESRMVGPFVAERDVIVFDQRGVGLSTPELSCPAVEEFVLEQLEGKIDAEAEGASAVYGACHERLAADGVNFTAYNSVASAHDVEAVRVGLGYEQLNLLGSRYGSRLAQTITRLYPSSVRSVALDSVLPVAANVDESEVASVERSLRLVFDACAADAACSAKYPTFEEDYFSLVDALNVEPAEVGVFDLDQRTYTFVFDGDDLVRLTRLALGSKKGYAALPALVASANDGDYAAISSLASFELADSRNVAAGMRYTVQCHEEVPFESPDVMAANEPSDPPYDRLTAINRPASSFDICTEWDAGTAAAVENEPVQSDIPTLLMSGTFDPVTPPSYAQQVAEHLDDSHLVEFPAEGRSNASTDCGTGMIVAFFDDPTVAPDSSCVDDMPPPAWVVGGDVTMVPFEETNPVPYSGLRPDGWQELGPGIFSRLQTASDQAGVIMQPLAGTDPAELVSTLETTFRVTFSEVDPLDVDGQRMRTFDADGGPVLYRVLVTADNDFFVILVAARDEFDELFEAAAIPAAASLRLG